MSLRFKGADLRPVLTEAEANKCRVVLVKDHGVYFLAERGERTPEGRQKLLAYAIGCNLTSTRSMIGGNAPEPSWVAMISQRCDLRSHD